MIARRMADALPLRNRGEPSRFSRVAAPMLAAAMRRANHRDLERLKQLLKVALRRFGFRLTKLEDVPHSPAAVAEGGKA